jgi:hypothetical protein
VTDNARRAFLNPQDRASADAADRSRLGLISLPDPFHALELTDQILIARHRHRRRAAAVASEVEFRHAWLKAKITGKSAEGNSRPFGRALQASAPPDLQERFANAVGIARIAAACAADGRITATSGLSRSPASCASGSSWQFAIWKKAR